MKNFLKIFSTLSLLIACIADLHAQSELPKPAKVDFEAYEKLVSEVKKHRQSRLVSIDRFQEMSRRENVIILDTRSAEMFRRKHIKGAVNLNFSDFTQENLAALIPGPDTKILIYCNNNIEGDQINFATKTVKPLVIGKDVKAITLALNIPTYINLYGYGYRNVYELSGLVFPWDKRIAFEGTEVKQHN